MKIKLIKTDITTLHLDAIVNAANSSLMGGGGVDGAIHRAGGPAILKACKRIRQTKGKCLPGQAVITTGGELTAQHVIHTVGPRYKDGHHCEAERLAECYKNALALAQEYQCQSLAFPNISTGIYGFPKKEAAQIAINTVLKTDTSRITQLVFACFDQENYALYQKILQDKNKI